MIIDTHAHLMFDEYEGQIPQMIERAQANDVNKIVNIGCNIKSSQQAIDLLSEWEGFYATVGIHPYDADQVTDELLIEWKSLIETEDRVVGIGECGLDYFKAKVPHDLQKSAFIMQLNLAQQTGLPLIIHNRDADDDCLAILDEFNDIDRPDRAKVVFHCFGSDLDFAKEIWLRGYYTSFTGIITYPNAADLREVVKNMPLDKFMVETDCPYLAPQDYRGERNEPSFVVKNLEKIAEIRDIDLAELTDIVLDNTYRFFDRI